MFCPNCGNNIPDDSAFCGHCGAAFGAAPAAPVAPPVEAPVMPPMENVMPPVAPVMPPMAPAYAVAQPPLSAKKRGLSKKAFLKTEATPTVKMASKIALIIFAIIAALMITATLITNSTSLLDLPIVTMALDDEARDDIETTLDEASASLEKAEDLLDKVDEEYGGETTEKAEVVLDKLEKTIDKMSLNNAIALVNACQDMVASAEDEAIEMLEIEDSIDAIEGTVSLLEIVRIVTFAIAGLFILLALWAACGKKPGLCVLSIILYVPACALLSSIALAGAIFVAFVALIVCTSMVNKAWKKTSKF